MPDITDLPNAPQDISKIRTARQTKGIPSVSDTMAVPAAQQAVQPTQQAVAKGITFPTADEGGAAYGANPGILGAAAGAAALPFAAGIDAARRGAAAVGSIKLNDPNSFSDSASNLISRSDTGIPGALQSIRSGLATAIGGTPIDNAPTPTSSSSAAAAPAPPAPIVPLSSSPAAPAPPIAPSVFSAAPSASPVVQDVAKGVSGFGGQPLPGIQETRGANGERSFSAVQLQGGATTAPSGGSQGSVMDHLNAAQAVYDGINSTNDQALARRNADIDASINNARTYDAQQRLDAVARKADTDNFMFIPATGGRGRGLQAAAAQQKAALEANAIQQNANAANFAARPAATSTRTPEQEQALGRQNLQDDETIAQAPARNQAANQQALGSGLDNQGKQIANQGALQQQGITARLLDPNASPDAVNSLARAKAAQEGRILDRTFKVGGGVDADGNKLPDRVYDQESGKFIEQPSSQPKSAPPAAAVAMLKKDPTLKAAFEQKYGPGSADGV